MYLICGNCGADDAFEYRTFDKLIDNENNLTNQIQVEILCINCGTQHYLEDHAKEIIK